MGVKLGLWHKGKNVADSIQEHGTEEKVWAQKEGGDTGLEKTT